MDTDLRVPGAPPSLRAELRENASVGIVNGRARVCSLSVATVQLPPLAELHRAACALWPDRPLSRFRVRNDGWANLILFAEPGLAFRFPRFLVVAERVGFEVRLLEYLSEHITTPVPTPLRVGVLPRPKGWPFFCYPRIPGVPLSEVRSLSPRAMARLGTFLERLLSELARLPRPPLARLGCPPGDVERWANRYRRLFGRYERIGAPRVPAALDRQMRAVFEGFFRTLRSTRFRPVLSHRDLGAYNILWNSRTGQPSGVVDWEDTRFGDPAFDLTGLTFLPASMLRRLESRRHSRSDSTYAARLEFYRKAVPLQELLYAVEQDRRDLFRQKLRELRNVLAE